MPNIGIPNTFARAFMPLFLELMACRERNDFRLVCAARRPRIRLFEIQCAVFSCVLVMTAAISSIKSAKAEVKDDIQEISIDYLWSHKLAPEHVSGNLVLRDITITRPWTHYGASRYGLKPA